MLKLEIDPEMELDELIEALKVFGIELDAEECGELLAQISA